MDWNLVLDIVGLLCILGVLRGLVEIRRAIELSMNELDHKLAATIQNLVQEGLGGFEPPNPIQQAIDSKLTQRVQPGATEILREATGEFKKSE